MRSDSAVAIVGYAPAITDGRKSIPNSSSPRKPVSFVSQRVPAWSEKGYGRGYGSNQNGLPVGQERRFTLRLVVSPEGLEPSTR